MKVVLDTSVLVAAAIAWYEERSAVSRWLVEVAWMGQRRYDKVIETAMNANVDAIVSEDNDLHDVTAQRSIAKTGIGIRDRPIQVWKTRTLVAALSGRPRFSPLVLPATVAA